MSVTSVNWNPVLSASLPIMGAGIATLFIWSVQRIIKRIDHLTDTMVALGTRVAVIEAKQDSQLDTADRVDKVTRITAATVGAHLPPELANTRDPRRRR